jgi:hypothetical protein
MTLSKLVKTIPVLLFVMFFLLRRKLPLMGRGFRMMKTERKHDGRTEHCFFSGLRQLFSETFKII